MNREEARILILGLMEENGLIEQGWIFKFDQAKKRAGQCNYTHKTISMSALIIELNEWEQVRLTAVHEIAHALTPEDGHGRAWKAKCIALGGNGIPRFNPKHKIVPKGKYEAECPSCKHIFYFHKKIKVGSRYSCPSCSGSRFNDKFELVFLPMTQE